VRVDSVGLTYAPHPGQSSYATRPLKTTLSMGSKVAAESTWSKFPKRFNLYEPRHAGLEDYSALDFQVALLEQAVSLRRVR
jgi:hypothetical protein